MNFKSDYDQPSLEKHLQMDPLPHLLLQVFILPLNERRKAILGSIFWHLLRKMFPQTVPFS